MAPATVSFSSVNSSSEFLTRRFEPHWYAAYTCANHEKQVAAQFAERHVEHFLPLYETVHRWKYRRVHLQLPLFPGYIFVHLALRDRLSVLQVPSVVRLVGASRGMPEALPEDEIQTLRSGLSSDLHARPHRYLTVGRHVRIKNGPLAGLEGILQRTKAKCRIVISVDLITQSIAVEADAADVELARPGWRRAAG